MCTQDNEAGIQQVRPCLGVSLQTSLLLHSLADEPSIVHARPRRAAPRLQTSCNKSPARLPSGVCFRYMHEYTSSRTALPQAHQTNHAAAVRQGLALGTTLHFEFYQEAAPQDARLRMIHMPRMDAFPETEHEIMHRLVQAFAVPEKLRCDALVACLHGLHAGSTCVLCSGMQGAGRGA